MGTSYSFREFVGKISRFEKNLRRDLPKTHKSAAKTAVKLAKQLAPKKTGELKSNIMSRSYKTKSDIYSFRFAPWKGGPGGQFNVAKWANMEPGYTSRGKRYNQVNHTGVPGYMVRTFANLRRTFPRKVVQSVRSNLRKSFR